jgi:hypothetical protein
MRRHLLVLLVACKSSGSDVPASSHATRIPLPVVVAADAVGATSGPAPLLVLVDEAGGILLSTAPSWAELTSFGPETATAVSVETARKLILMARDRGWTPAQTIAAAHGESVVSDDALEHDGNKMAKDVAPQPRNAHADVAGGFGSFGAPIAGAADLGLRTAQVAGEVVDVLAPTQPAVCARRRPCGERCRRSATRRCGRVVRTCWRACDWFRRALGEAAVNIRTAVRRHRRRTAHKDVSKKDSRRMRLLAFGRL